MPALLNKLSQSTFYLLWLEIETPTLWFSDLLVWNLLWFNDLLVWNNSAIWLSPEDGYLPRQTLPKQSRYKGISIALGSKMHLLMLFIYIWHPILAWNYRAFQNISAFVLQALLHRQFSLGKARTTLWVYVKSSKNWLTLPYFYSSQQELH